jgi:hypothetical protein
MFDDFIDLLADDPAFTDWEIVDDAVIVCPHGHSIEWDGRCPDGCVSPFMTLGLI